MNTNTFDFGRLMALLRLDFISKKKTYLYGALSLLVLYSFVCLINAGDGSSSSTDFHHNFFPILLLSYGFVYSSYAFSEMNQPLERQTYLTLPASNLEKITSKWLLTFVVFPIVFVASYFALSLFVDRIVEFATLTEIQRPSIENVNFFLVLKIYFAVQAQYIIGSILFNKYAFMKTGISGFLIFLIGVFVMFCCVRVIFWDYFDGWSLELGNPTLEGNVHTTLDSSFMNFIGGPLRTGLEYLLWIGSPILLWVVAYFKLKEKEV